MDRPATGTGSEERPRRDAGSILIAGCGIGGLAASIALASRGFRVHIVEKRTGDFVYGVGLNNPPNALRALDRLGLLDAVLAAGAPLQGFQQYDARGVHVGVYAPPVPADGLPAGCALPRPALHAIMRSKAESLGVTISYGVWVEEFTQEAEQVHVLLSNGSRSDHGAYIAFDGIRSATRRALFGDAHEPRYTGYSVWRKTVPRPAGLDFTEAYIGERAKASVILLTESTMYLLVVTEEPVTWRPPTAQLHTLLRERLAGFEGLIGRLRDTELDGPDGIVYSPLEEVVLPLPWSVGRVIVLGDAAHACTPHLTQGAAMALEDAVVVADELGSDADVVAALQRVGPRRIGRVGAVQRVSEELLRAEMTGDGRSRLTAHALVRTRQQEITELLGTPA